MTPPATLAPPPWWQTLLQRDSLRYLTGYMCMLLVVMLAATLAFRHQGLALPDRILWLLLPCQTLLTLATFIGWRRRATVTVSLYLLLLFGSIALLGWYLHDAGGHTNPVISLLLVPLAMGAALMGWQATALIAIGVLLVYTALTQYFIPLDVVGAAADAAHSHHQGHGVSHDFMQLHLIGMWLTFAVSVLLIVGLVLPLAQSMRRQRDQIARQQEKMLQDEKLIAMATFAASAAHQLGTPLSTLAVLTDDLKDTLTDRTDLIPDLQLMAQQIHTCKATLHGLMRKADNLRNDVREPVAIHQLTQRLRQQFNLLHPARELSVVGEPPTCTVLGDETLDQALLNLLDNAARVSPTEPELTFELQGDTLCLRITDSGPGIPDSIRPQLGEAFVSSRQDGLGLGLFLSHATINRLGGTLRLLPAPENRGTVTEVRLPLTGPKP
ncbi:MAG TPA: HAMP domain-containing sensor histidine kinase [Dongiaceae bacterium]|nr:HAMP domain-containing sensor histidine kinase [Dongiaceae bacterium]